MADIFSFENIQQYPTGIRKLVYSTEMLLIESSKKNLTVIFIFNNHDINKGDIQQMFWFNT